MHWWVRMMVDGCSLKTMLDLQRMFTETDFRPELRRISVPTLLIHGDNDTSTPIAFAPPAWQLLSSISSTLVESGTCKAPAESSPVWHCPRCGAAMIVVQSMRLLRFFVACPPLAAQGCAPARRRTRVPPASPLSLRTLSACALPHLQRHSDNPGGVPITLR